jgi:hypothetical protein
VNFKNIARLAVGLSIVLSTSAARAAFVNGVERFNGTSFDLTTWEGHFTLGTHIAWNEAMHFDNRQDAVQAGGRGEMVTVAPIVGVGEFVEAQVNLLGWTEVSPMVSLRLSTKTHVNNSNLDSHTFEVNMLPFFNMINATQTQNGNGFGGPLVELTAPDALSSQTYFLRIERASSILARFMAFDANHQQLGVTYQHTLLNFPDDMHVVVYSQQAAANFDNVTVGAIPEPSTMVSALALGAITLSRRPRRGETRG